MDPLLCLLPFVFVCGVAEPPASLDDLARFPSAERVRSELARSKELRRECLFQANFHGERAWYWSIWEQDLREAVRPWSTLETAHDRDARDSVRRNALERLRQRIGADEYRRGRMPAVIPSALAGLAMR